MRRLAYLFAALAVGCFTKTSQTDVDPGIDAGDAAIGLADGSVDGGTVESGSGAPALSPAAIDLGTTQCGSIAAAKPLEISNEGSAPFTITAMGFAQGTFTVSGPSLPQVVSPGASITFDIGAPAAARAIPQRYTDTLTITTSAGVRTLIASEDVAGVLIDWNPALLAFTVTTSGIHTRTMTLRNRGTQAATVRVTRDAASSQYIQIATAPPSSIAAGANGEGTIEFAARAVGTSKGKLIATEVSNAPKCGAASVELDIAATYQP